MVNLQGKKTTTSREIKDALSSNLNIIASDSRLKTIVDKIADSRYRIKDLSTITNVNRLYNMSLVDGKLFILPTASNLGNIQVFDYQTDVLLKTINHSGANVETTAICYDAGYIYISKCVQRTTDKKYRDVYVRKYNRLTLDLVSESPILYTGVTGTNATNSSNIYEMTENGEYLYLACVQNMDTAGVFDKILKIKKTDFSSVADIAWNIPLNIIKHTNGFFVTGYNGISGDVKYRRIDLLDWDLGIIQTLPKTTTTSSTPRNGFYKDDFLYVANDDGVLVKYQVSTNTIIKETPITGNPYIRSVILINGNYILLQINTSELMMYDLNLNFIKMWNFYNTTSTGGRVVSDNNNTIWTYSASQPFTIYKKQFIDMTSNII